RSVSREGRARRRARRSRATRAVPRGRAALPRAPVGEGQPRHRHRIRRHHCGVRVITDRPLLTLAPGFATSLVFLVGTVLQRALIGSRVAQPARLGPESCSKGISLLFSVLAGYLAIVVVSMIFSEATGFSGRHLYLGFLLILLLFTAP